MLALARAAIVSELGGQGAPQGITKSASLSRKLGVFVTLEVFGKLRGCIGVIEPRDSVAENIVHCARSAAFRDPRFPPLRTEELHGLEIEISVLSDLAPIAPEAVQIGRHGLVIATHDHRGLLLPQVATEHHLSREEFLAETCHKAGLPRHAWRDAQTEIYGFTCEIFRETSARAVSE